MQAPGASPFLLIMGGILSLMGSIRFALEVILLPRASSWPPSSFILFYFAIDMSTPVKIRPFVPWM